MGAYALSISIHVFAIENAEICRDSEGWSPQANSHRAGSTGGGPVLENLPNWEGSRSGRARSGHRLRHWTVADLKSIQDLGTRQVSLWDLCG